MKVLYLISGISSSAGWGTEYIQNLIISLSNKGIEPTIVSPILLHTNEDWKEWSKRQYEKYHVRIIAVDLPDWLKKKAILHLIITNIFSTLTAIRILVKERFDLIHEFSSAPIALLRSFIFKMFFDIPTVFTLSLYNNTFFGNLKWINIFNFANNYAIPSKEIINSLLKSGISANKISYIPPCIDLNLFTEKKDCLTERKKMKLEKNMFILTYYGTLTKEKGVFDLLSAYKSLNEHLKNKIQLMLCVVWRGSPEHHKIKKYIESLKEKNIKLIEKYVDIASLIYASDAIILPQQTGNGTTIPPISVIEVLATGKPLIATDIIGNREAVSDGLGILVKPQNQTMLKKAIEKLWKERSVKKKTKNFAKKSYFSLPTKKAVKKFRGNGRKFFRFTDLFVNTKKNDGCYW